MEDLKSHHILAFLEEAQLHGVDYAEQRLLQRLAMGLCNATGSSTFQVG